MKKIYLTIAIIIMAASVQAQFSITPSQPMAVCAEANDQSNVRFLSDGNGGYFVFWHDKRSNSQKADLYGQHLDMNGVALWTPGGKAIVAHATKNILNYHCVLYQGSILVTWIQSAISGSGDSLLCKKINFSGNDLWPQPVSVDQSGGSVLSMETYSLNTFENYSGVSIVYSRVYIGGSSGMAYNRISPTGALRWSSPITPSLPGYVFFSESDGQNGFYSLSRGNGLGSGMFVQHFNLQGVAQWPNAVDLSQGVGANGFGGTHSSMHDSNGNFYLAWQSSANKILAATLTTAGIYGWTPNVKQVANVASQQSRPFAMMNNNNMYITWLEDRIPNQTSLYTQKLNSSGADVWAANGVFSGVANGYYAYPKLAMSDSNAVFVAFLGSGNVDLTAQRIRSNGTLTWSGNGKIMSSVSQNWISYNDYVVAGDPAGCNAVFWTSFNSNIYGAKICSNGNLVKLDDHLLKEDGISIYPNPAENDLKISTHTGSKITAIEIYSSHGKLVLQHQAETGKPEQIINIDNLNPGIYFVKCISNTGQVAQKIIVQ